MPVKNWYKHTILYLCINTMTTVEKLYDSIFQVFFFKLTYSRVATSVVSTYRKNAEGVSWFYETLEGLNTAGEVDIILEYFKCPRPTSTSF